MKTKLLAASMVLLLTAPVLAQTESNETKVDSLSNFAYLYKGEPMPFDSGVAVSDRQYQYLFKLSLISRIENGVNDILTPVPRTVYVDKIVRKKGDGNKGIWFAIGAAGGSLITTLIFVLTK